MKEGADPTLRDFKRIKMLDLINIVTNSGEEGGKYTLHKLTKCRKNPENTSFFFLCDTNAYIKNS